MKIARGSRVSWRAYREVLTLCPFDLTPFRRVDAPHYIDTMGFGYTTTINGSKNTPVITDSLLQGGIVSVYYLGTLVGALVAGLVAERYGRIKTIAVGAGWAILGAALQCSAQNANWMIVGEPHRIHVEVRLAGLTLHQNGTSAIDVSRRCVFT